MASDSGMATERSLKPPWWLEEAHQDAIDVQQSLQHAFTTNWSSNIVKF